MNPFPRHATNPGVDKELKQIATASKAALRERYIQLFKREPPKAFRPDLLRRCVAQRLQENVYGGLSKAAQRELNRLVRAMIARPDTRLKVVRQAKSGTHLVRDFKGKSYRILIMADGFSYEGKVYSNLSEIARLITGTRWNGPRFFGLRRSQADASDDTPPPPKRLPKEDTIPMPSPSKFKRAPASHGL